MVDFWAGELETCLSGPARMNGEQVEAVLIKYRAVAAKTTPQDAFKELLSAYGNQDVDQAFEASASLIFDALNEANKHGIETNSILRYRQKLARFNANVKKLAIEIDEPDSKHLSKWQIESIQKAKKERENLEVKPFKIYSNGTIYKNKPVQLEVEVFQQ